MQQQLPTRVVDVGSITSPFVRLHESNGETEHYICLSHCWGRKEFLQTTTANIIELKREIPWSALPKTFQDAIIFTRNLGIRWIWIDSLCIIQDNPFNTEPSDWQKEAAKMASVYSNSYVTLAAATSADSDGGCFTQAHHRTHLSRQIPVVNDVDNHSSSMAKVYARIELHHVTDPSEVLHPLLKRAWVFQERLLSTRLLYFAGYELHWECNKLSVCECGSEEASRRFTDPKVDFNQRFQYMNDDIRLQSHQAHRTEHETPSRKRRFDSFNKQPIQQSLRWSTLIKVYTRLSLTYPSDIFPALSGLAREWNSKIDDEYVAGMWRKTLFQELCWYTRQSMRRPESWRAPSWSWASVDTPIETWSEHYTHHNRDEDALEILEAECTPIGADYAGELSSGRLLISGRATTCSLYYWKKADNPKPACRLIVDDIWLGSFGRAFLDCPVWEEGPGHLESPSEVQLLMMGEDPSVHSLKYLILIPSLTADGKLERIGYTTTGASEIGNENLVPREQWDMETDPSEWKIRISSSEMEPLSRDMECVGVDTFMKDIGRERYRQLKERRRLIGKKLEHALRSAPRRTFDII